MDPFVARFLAWLRIDKGLAPNTISSYQTDLQQFTAFLAPKKIVEAQEPDILAFLERSKQAQQKNSSLRRKISCLKSFYKFCTLESLASTNPTSSLDSPKTGRTLPKYLNAEEIEKIFQAIPTDTLHGIRDRALLEILYATGMRVSELAQLQHKDWLEQEHAFRVKGKGSKERIVLYSQRASEWLQKYNEKVFHEWNKGFASEYFFLATPASPTSARKKNASPNGLSRQFIWALLKHYAFLAGIKKNISPHQFRHSFATHLVQAGMNLRFVQSLLGHSDISTTQIYTHTEEKKLVEAHKKFHPRK